MKSTLLRCWILFVGLSVLASAVAQEAGEEQTKKRIALIKFDGMIRPLTENLFHRQLEKAKDADVDVVVVEIYSPGGYVTTSLDLANTLLDLEWADTVAYVPREALSGAAIMSLGCDEILMARDARIGDAGPIFQGDDALFRHAPEKIRSDLVAQVRVLANEHDRPPAIAEAMVDMDLVVFKVTHKETGEVTYKSNPELEEMDDVDQWDKGPPVQESRDGLFLEVIGERAVQLNLADAVVNNRRELAEHFDIEQGEILEFESTWVDILVMILNNWFVTALLIFLGVVALYFEFSAPGTSIGGLLAGLCFCLFFWSRFLGGTSGWLEVILFVGGIVFVLVEMFVIPGFGFAGVTGGLLIVASLLMASQNFSPNDGLPVADITKSVFLLVSVGVFGVAAMAMISRRLGSIPIFNKLSLQPPTSEVGSVGDGVVPISAAAFGVTIGAEGVADSALRPAGRAVFGDNYVDVVTDGSFIDQGDAIKVINISGNRIMVRKIV